MKIPPLDKHSQAINRLLKRLEALANEYGCEFDLITKSELKHIAGLRSTGEIIRYTALLYPELAALYDKGAPTEHRYYKKLYEAVLSAHIFQQRLQHRAGQLEDIT